MNPKLHQQYQRLQILVYALQLEAWPLEEIDKPTAFAEIIRFSQVLGIEIDPSDPAFLPTLQAKINELLAVPKPETPNIPPNLNELVEIYEKANQKQKIKIQKLIFPTLDEQIEKLQNQYAQKIHQELTKTEPILSQNPSLTKEISQNLANKLITNLPLTARPEIFTPKEYEDLLNQSQTTIMQELKRAGITQPKIEKAVLAKLAQETLPEVKRLSTTPHSIFPIRLVVKPPLSEKIPEPVLTKMAQQPEGIASPLVFNLLYPPTAFSFAKKIILTPSVKPLQWVAKNAEGVIPQAKLAIVRGLTNKDLQESIAVLENLGLPTDHPQIDKLHRQAQRLQEFESSHQILSFILRNYYEYPKKINRLQIQEPETGIYLPRLSPPPVWHQQKGYSWQLRQGLNKFGFLTKTQQKVSLAPEKTILRSAFFRFRQFIYQKTLKPIVIWLGKTFFGKAAKTGAKRVATWTATKLGLGTLTRGLGFLSLAWPKIKKILKSAGVALGGLLIAAAQIGIGAVVGTIVGSIGGLVGGVWLGLKAGAAVGIFGAGPVGAIVGGAIGAVVGGIVGFFSGWAIQTLGDKLATFFSNASIPQAATAFSAQTTAAATTTLGKVFVGTLAGAGVGTVIISQVVSSSFIIPSEGEIQGSHYIQATKTAQFSGHVGDKINYTLGVNSTGKPLINVEIIDEPSASCQGQSPNLKKQSWSQEEIITGNPWQIKYNLPTNETFDNCLIINRVTVTANVEGEPDRQQTTINAIVTIGNPPEDCPQGWPTTSGYIVQGPDGSYSHQGREAIDIGMPIGTPVYATHKGFAFVGIGADGGKGVWLTNTCGGIQFRSTYYHLDYWTVENGQQVNRGDRIGLSGNTGNTTGPHLHYEFKPANETFWTDKKLEIGPPYIPQSVPRGCNSQEGCQTSW